MDKDLGKRLFDFAVRVIRFCRNIKKTTEYQIIVYQLTKSATSSGANYSPCEIA